MHTSESIHSGGWYTDVSIKRGGGATADAYRTAINHATGDADPGREHKTLPLKRLVDFADIIQLVSALGSRCPRLYQLEDLIADFGVDGGWSDGFQEGDQVVQKLARGNLHEEMGSTILYAGVSELCPVSAARPEALSLCMGAAYVEGAELRIGVLVANTLL